MSDENMTKDAVLLHVARNQTHSPGGWGNRQPGRSAGFDYLVEEAAGAAEESA